MKMYKVYHGTNTLGTIETKPMLYDLLEIEGSYYKVVLLPQGRKRGINVVPWSEILGDTSIDKGKRDKVLEIEFKAINKKTKEVIGEENLIFACGMWLYTEYGIHESITLENNDYDFYQKDKFEKWNKVK